MPTTDVTAEDTPDAPPTVQAPPATRAPSGGSAALALAALGVVFGDIGTSPLYALQAVFALDHGAVHPTRQDVLGVLSMVVWSVVLVVTVKYVALVMRADNDGEGGVLALAALVRRVMGDGGRRALPLLLLGVLGAALFYGDSVITPAISVLSAFEGLQVVAPALKSLVVPLAVVVLLALFAVQRAGTEKVGRLFGPVMLAWFVVIGLAGLPHVVGRPGVLVALSPTYAVAFLLDRPVTALLAMGAVVLTITGCEALYADMGHFGRGPVRRAWFAVVLPALLLCYLGQGALVLQDPSSVRNPFFLLMPTWAQVPVVVLAALATVIASQAVISGAFSLSRQAVRLGLLPPLRIRQTSESEGGQIYVPAVNGLLLVGVLLLLLAFRASSKLATAYGIAVTGTLLITTLLFLVVARRSWHWPVWALVLFGGVIGGLELVFFLANTVKFLSGGWLPLSIALVLFVLMSTWRRGRELVRTQRAAAEGDLRSFVAELEQRGVPRVPGTAVFPHPDLQTAPLAMRALVDSTGVLHEHVVVVTAQAQNVPHVPADERLDVDDLGPTDDGIVHVTVRYGFSDPTDLAAALEQAAAAGLLEGTPDLAHASYVVSRATLRRSSKPGMARWRKALFVALAHNAADPAEALGLPVERVVTMGTTIAL